MSFLSLLGLGGGKIKAAIRNGAVIIDVRTPQEFDNGKVPGSLNIPVDRIDINLERIKDMNKPIILCCDSGARSEEALRKLRSGGVKEIYNVGNWRKVLRIVQSL